MALRAGHLLSIASPRRPVLSSISAATNAICGISEHTPAIYSTGVGRQLHIALPDAIVVKSISETANAIYSIPETAYAVGSCSDNLLSIAPLRWTIISIYR